MVFVRSLVLLLKFLFLYSLFSFPFTTSLPQIQPKCHQYESQALLHFKEGFVINNLASDNRLGYPTTASWNSSTDCCSWDGIKCHEHTNHVIHIDLSSSQLYGKMDANSSLFRLVHLRILDLSDNDFNYSQIPPKIGELSQLKYLSLSRSLFSGEIPPQVSQLSKLLSLDLGCRAMLRPKVWILEHRHNPEFRGPPRKQIMTIFWFTFSTMFFSHRENTVSGLGRFALIIWLFVVLIINSSYTASFKGKRKKAPVNWHNLSSLTKIFLDQTSFSGTLPVSIGKLSSLISLSIPVWIYSFFTWQPHKTQADNTW